MEENIHEQDMTTDVVVMSPSAIDDYDDADELQQQISQNIKNNLTLVDTNVHFVGDNEIISNIVQLIAYIRHAVKNNLETTITVKVGENVANAELLFDVNGLEIKDLKTKPEIVIS